jgi:hypothetical protein
MIRLPAARFGYVALALTFQCASSPPDHASGAAPELRYGQECKSAKDCVLPEECTKHYGFAGPESSTCEIACDPFKPVPDCPEKLHCSLIDDGPRTKKGGICLRHGFGP